MLNGKKIVVVMPAYNAAATLSMTYDALPHDVVDMVILTDDCSSDETVRVALEMGIHVIRHDVNKGYGGNQKSCYQEALGFEADIVVMVHPDYQYDPRLVTAMAAMVSSGVYDVCLASRILGNTALRGGMPMYKYISNRLLTLFQNLCLGTKLSEYHTGYRAYSKEALGKIEFNQFEDGFVFDNQILVDALLAGIRIGEISCPTKYFTDASSISFVNSVRYGFGVVRESLRGLWLRSLGNAKLTN